MEQNRFFKWIWRIVAIGLLLMLLAGLYSFIRSEVERLDRHSMNKREPISSLAEDPQKVEKWVLRANPYMDAHSDYTVLSLYSQYNKVKNINQSYYATTSNVERYYNESAKNILFVNIKEGTSSWLFPTNNQLILGYGSELTMLGEGLPYYIGESIKKEKPKPTFIYYKLINKDSNGDKIITESDHLSFAISDILGKNYKVLIEDIERIISMKMMNKETLSLIYQRDGIAHSLKLNTNNFEVISDVALPKVGG